MKTVCKIDICNGCHACAALCPCRAITIEDSLSQINAIIDENKCINCGLCNRICPHNENKILFSKPVSWYQGWASNNEVRMNSASGGIAAAIMKSFIAHDGVVATCAYENGEFNYKIIEEIDEIHTCVGSMYVKSNPGNIYKLIIEKVKRGVKVLFIGLPCHVAAVKNSVPYKYSDFLYSVDLICHGSPSPKMLERYLVEHGIILKDVNSIKFRVKNDFRLIDDSKPITTPGVTDRYLYTFLRRINYTENCYTCEYARIERISDLTIGDSWGSELSLNEQEKGISLILCQNEKGEELLRDSDLNLHNVNLENAIKHNLQLQGPAKKPETREKFFKLIKEGVKYDRAVLLINPQMCIKQDIKKILIKMKILGGGI